LTTVKKKVIVLVDFNHFHCSKLVLYSTFVILDAVPSTDWQGFSGIGTLPRPAKSPA